MEAHLWVTYLSTTKLQVRSVYLSSQDLVQSGSSGQNDRLTLDLHSSVTQSEQVSTNTNRSSRDQRDGEDVVVSSRRGTSDETGSLETFNPETILETDDSGNLMSPLPVCLDLIGDNATSCYVGTLFVSNGMSALKLSEVLTTIVLQFAHILWGQVEVLDTLLGTRRVIESTAKETDNLLGQTDSSTRIRGQVDPR